MPIKEKARKPGSGGARAGSGRKPMDLDLVEIEKLSALQCTDIEIAAWFGVNVKTIENKRKDPVYADAMDRGKGKGRISLRRLQMKAAEAGNPALLIFLGKSLLGQRDYEREPWRDQQENKQAVKVQYEWVARRSGEKSSTNHSQVRNDSTTAEHGSRDSQDPSEAANRLH